MRIIRLPALAILAGLLFPVVARADAVALPLNDASVITPHHVTVNVVHYAGSDALEVRQAGQIRGFDPDTFAFVPGVDFHDGTIEVDVAGSPLPSALPTARGFVGIAFRIDVERGSFACEGLYIRPTNGRADDQLRRNHSTQYFSYPDYDFGRLRREAPGQYESYTDLVPDEWMRVDPFANRGIGHEHPILRQWLGTTDAHCAGSEARGRRARTSRPMGGGRHERSFSQLIDPPEVTPRGLPLWHADCRV